MSLNLMNRHLTTNFLISLLMLSSGIAYSEPLSVNKAIKLFIENSLDLKIQNLNAQEAKAKTQIYLGLYDFILQSNIEYTQSPFVGLNSYGVDAQSVKSTTQIQKKFPYGVRFSLGSSWEKQDHTQITGGFIPPSNGHLTQVFLEAQIPLLNNIFGTLDRAQLTQYRLKEKIAKLQTLKAIINLVTEGMGIYKKWHISKRSVAFKKASLTRAQKLLRLNLKKQKDGLLEAGEVAQTHASVQAREIDLLEAENQLDQASHTLAAFINIEKSSVDQYTADHLDKTLADYTENFPKKDLWANNVDVALATSSSTVSTIALAEKSHDKWIELNAFGRIALDDADAMFGNSLDNLFFDNPTYVTGLNLVIPLGNEAKRGTYQLSYLAKHRSDIQLEQAQKTVYETYTGRQKALERLKAQISRSKKLLQFQKDKLLHENKKFHQGRSSITLLLQFQDELTQYEHQHEQLLTSYVSTRVDTQLMDATLLKAHQINLPKRMGP
jgi:outer membrane protein TolC